MTEPDDAPLDLGADELATPPTDDADAERAAAAGVSPDAASEARERSEARELTELRDLAQRVQADFENYRKRVLREQTSIVERAAEGLVEQLLPVLDSFELASASLDEAPKKVRKGVELVRAELLGVLERAGLEPINAVGAPFDPNEHEAVIHEEGAGEPVVTETMRTGYRWKGRVLRPAMVKVGRVG